RGTVVLASDAAHLYANITRRIPFPIFIDEAAYGAAQARVMDLAGGSLDHVIPGHDPLVLERFPAENDIARVDLPPLRPIAETPCRPLDFSASAEWARRWQRTLSPMSARWSCTISIRPRSARW